MITITIRDQTMSLRTTTGSTVHTDAESGRMYKNKNGTSSWINMYTDDATGKKYVANADDSTTTSWLHSVTTTSTGETKEPTSCLNGKELWKLWRPKIAAMSIFVALQRIKDEEVQSQRTQTQHQDEEQEVVFDNGSYLFKAGFAGDDAPRANFLTIVGQPKHPELLVGMKRTPTYVGSEAWSKQSVLNLIRPIERGIITNWDAMEDIWRHTFYNELKVDPEETPILLTEPPLNPKINRERMTQIMFETFNVPSMYVSIQSVLSLYASGRTSGVVVDSGWEMTSVVSVYEGYCLPHTVVRIDLAGRHLTDYMMKNLTTLTNNNTNPEIVCDIKEKYCHVSMNYQDDMTKEHQERKPYVMPDGDKIDIESCVRLCPEILFNPYFNGRTNNVVLPSVTICVALLSARHKRLGAKSSLKKIPSFLLRKILTYIPNTNTGFGGGLFSEARLHQLVCNSINKCDTDIRSEMYVNIVLSGGNTMFSGIKERLTKEIVNLAPKEMIVVVFCPGNRKYSAWSGGSILASARRISIRTGWISRSDYENAGPSIVHRMCW